MAANATNRHRPRDRSAIRARGGAGGVLGLIGQSSFWATLKNTLIPARGAGSPNYTRATVATFTDFQPRVVSVISGEARFSGARRVQNSVAASQDLTNGAWSGAGTGSSSATQVTFTASDYTRIINVNGGVGNGMVFTVSFKAAVSNGTAAIRFETVDSSDGSDPVFIKPTLDTTLRRYSFTANYSAVATIANLVFYINRSADAPAGTVMTFTELQCEVVSGQTNQNPSEYVSSGVLSSPYHGAGVDAVKYFATQNGNTVSSSIVTEAVGAAITPSGYLSEQAATQLVTPTASISNLTNAAWVKTTMTTAFTSTGPDGTANSATRCTASAGNATCIQTLVAAASSRTVSFLMKRVTGTGNIELTQDGAAFTNIASQLNSSTYTLVQLNASILNATFGFRIVTNGDAVDVAMAQFEAGAIATSRILTAGGTRNADALTYAVAGNIDNTVGSAYSEVTLDHLSSASNIAANIIGASGGATNALYFQVNGRPTMYDGTTAAAIVTTVAANTTAKLASSWSAATTLSIYINGGSKANAAFDGSMNFATIGIGGAAGAAAELNGCQRNVLIFPRALTDTEQALLASASF